jgi:hypothetical protein
MFQNPSGFWNGFFALDDRVNDPLLDDPTWKRWKSSPGFQRFPAVQTSLFLFGLQKFIRIYRVCL